MSRTKKDKPHKFLENYSRFFKVENRPKIKKEVDSEDHWMTTPSWWTRIQMNRPQRREAHTWETKIKGVPVDYLEDVDKPNVSHKPHVYYW